MIERPDLAMILGGAPCVRDDAQALAELMGGSWPGRVIAVNDIAVHWPGDIHDWVSLHPTKLTTSDPDDIRKRSWRAQRADAGHPGGYTTWSHRRPSLVDETVDFWGGGSSGLFAVTVAYHLGCDRVVLCGCPMDRSGHFEESRTSHEFTGEVDHYRKVWVKHKDEIRERTRSMSGWTRETFGEATLDWIEGGE